MKRLTVLATLMSLIVLLTLTPSSPALSSQQPGGQALFLPLIMRDFDTESGAVVRMVRQDYLQVAPLLTPSLIIDYGAIIWLELDGANMQILHRSGVAYQIQQDAHLLFLNRFQFDPLEGEPEIPPEQQTEYAPGEVGFYLVQLIGPTLEDWLVVLTDLDVGLVQFQPSHAYLVRMTPEKADEVAQLDFVRWVGVYHAAYRLAPTLLDLVQPPPPIPGSLQIIENVDITIFNDGQVEDTLASLGQMGGEVIQVFDMAPDGSLVTAIVALPATSVVPAAQLNAVLWLNFSSPEPGLDDEVSDQIVVGNHTAGVPFVGYDAWLNAAGVNGAGVTVAVVDTGMDTNSNATAHVDIAGRISAVVAYAGAPATDTNGHGTNVGGIIAGNAALGTTDPNSFLFGLGVAPNVQLVVQNALLGTSWPPAGGWQQLSRDSVVNGAVASNNSWFSAGTQGYSAVARTHDIMVRDADFSTAAIEPLIMVFSAGNAGPGASTITEPKEAKNLITVGASENLRSDVWVTPGGCGNPNNINNVTNFSSRGPALDGRILPNITAPGTFIASLRSATGTFGGLFCSGIIDANYVWFSGTSQAAPHVTGGVALIIEWWRSFNAGADPSPAMAKALLINGAIDMGGVNIPNNNQGWGRLNLDNIIVPPVPVIYLDQTTIFGATGQTWSLDVGPVDPTLPLKVTLVWSDAPGPGSGGATAAWVNDLDLTVNDATTTFLGNVFANGWSVAGGTADNQNNIENVFIQNPGGPYEITVTAANIAGDGVPGNADLTDQDFALVCFNCAVAADLEITKSDSPDPVVAGTPLTYLIEVTNHGPDDTSGVVVTDSLPPEVTFDPASSSPACSEAAGTVTCTAAMLASGDTVQFTLVVDVHPATPTGTVLLNTAEVTSNVPDPDLTNNSVTETTLVQAEADLEIVSFEVVDPPAEILVGEDIDILLRKVITNNGPSGPIDTTLTITATAPPDSSATPAVSTFDELALGIGEMREVWEMVTINCGQASQHIFTFTNEIEPLNPADIDPNLDNNVAVIELEVECVVPVAINIKPGSYPNSINPDGQGLIPVAVLTTLAGEYGTPLDFDATTIDPLSVRFGPRDLVWTETGGAPEAHGHGHIEDSYELDEVTKDGDLDMVLHFRTQETGIVHGDTEACIKGQWVDSMGGVHKFFGCDSVRTVPPFTSSWPSWFDGRVSAVATLEIASI
jgi:uncharacterized repeat protein (TIGR01451 family)